MAFWNDPSTEPMRQFKFLLTIGGGLESWVVKKVDRPSFKIGETTHTFLDKKFYFPGKLEWNDVKATIAEPVNVSQTSLLYGIILRAGYQPPSSINPTNLIGLSTVAKAPSILNVQIKMLNGAGAVIETWDLKNAWIKDVTFSGLDYEQEGTTTIDMTFRYDEASFS